MIKNTALALAAISAGVAAQANELSVTADISYVTDYVFRGDKLADASLQPSVEVSYAGAYAGVWYSDAISNKGTDSEADLYAGYGFAVSDTLTLDVGATRYTYNGGSDLDTTEGFLKLSADVLLSPTLAYYYDFDLETSAYEASIGYSLPVDAINSSLDFSGVIGTVQAPGEDRVYGSVGVAVPYALSETATLTVGVDYIVNDGKFFAGNQLLDGDKDTIVGKVGISIGF